MKKVISIVTVLSLVVTTMFSVTNAWAATTDWATNVVSSSQGLQKDGNPVNVLRSDPNAALGMSDGSFFSLGFGGEIVLEFPVKGHGNLLIATQEITGGSYPLEIAEVYVSDDNMNWTMVGNVDNESGTGDGISEVMIGGDVCVKYVKIIDITDPDLHLNSADAYDVDSVNLTYDEPCMEDEDVSDGDDTVKNSNSAFISNWVKVEANTGGNFADGSYGGSGGAGGNVTNDGEDVDESTTGNGGAGGDASDGGTIITGDAVATLILTNRVNTNITEIDRCGCGGDSDGDVRVINRNRAKVMNMAKVEAETGDNVALGSYAGSGGGGGNIDNQDEDVDEVTTGDGGTGGSGGMGGLIQTGRADSMVDILNVVNRNVTRIQR